MKVVKWTFWGDPMYPEADWRNEEETRLYELAVIEAIRKQGYRFTGVAHQTAQFCTPVMSDAKQFNISQRHWGGLIAEMLGIEVKYAYVVWAWEAPQEQKMPSPQDWETNQEELDAQDQRWQKYQAEMICGIRGDKENPKEFWRRLEEDR